MQGKNCPSPWISDQEFHHYLLLIMKNYELHLN